ncbi:testis-specific serine/threonine-protein kinase 3-like [Oppia nitens]|uniref:testis-specific serine/threonine-protein kinase 3-like n=1 Tax=Oppia nitens TaxID=1686743 RepID=UPI0023DAC9DF|nr:testis-specific serine/threonine-protein kinase 3-like [Oppia nitens]
MSKESSNSRDSKSREKPKSSINQNLDKQKRLSNRIKSSDNNKSVELPASDRDLLNQKGYTIGKQLNSGTFSKVCKANKDKKPMAVKIIDLTNTSTDYKNKFLPRELYVTKKLSHPFIIQVYDIYYIAKRVYVFMELAEGGDILDLVKKGGIIETKAKSLYKGLAEAMKYIHTLGIAHRDIKTENCLLIDKMKSVAKICDFGFSRACFDHNTGERQLSETYCGSVAYAAPEILKVRPYNPMISDVWSMGVVLFVMTNRRMPFNDENPKLMLSSQLEKKYLLSDSLSDDCKELIRRHLDPNTATRITMKDVVNHNWFKQ